MILKLRNAYGQSKPFNSKTLMSESAYYAWHRANYGCFPDDDLGETNDEIFCEECNTCGHSMNPDEGKQDEKTKEWTCVNCLENQQLSPKSGQ